MDLYERTPLGDASLLTGLVRALALEVDADATCTFLPTRTLTGWEARNLATSGLGAAFERRLDAFMRRAPANFACFDPLNPAQRDINVVVSLRTQRRRAAADGSAMWCGVFRGTELEHHDQLRLLLCHDDDTLAVIMLFSESAFSRSQQRRFARLTKTMLARFREERHHNEREWRREALVLALEMIGRPALVIDFEGRIERANGPAKRAVADPAFLAGLQQELAKGKPRLWELAPLKTSNGRRLVLAVRCPSTRHASARLHATTATHELTVRQREVLDRLLRGLGNKAIASELTCSVKNVEYHVSRLLATFGVETRAELTALVRQVES